MRERFGAFSFVDRILEIQPGGRATGTFTIPAILPEFPPCLVAEAVGQLAAWAAMAQVAFQRRPVAGLTGEVRLLHPVVPGQTLDLAVDIESCELDALAYAGRARAGGIPILELSQCVGPMLPMEEFDAPEGVRDHFALLCGSGAHPGRCRDIPRLELLLSNHDSRPKRHATLSVPEEAPFFADHFPRRPVLPGSLLLDAQIRLAMRLVADALDPGAGSSLEPARAHGLKLRAFIPPGATVEIHAELCSATAAAALVGMAARLGGRPVSTGRLEFLHR